MSTPDAPTWKGASLPPVGITVTVRHNKVDNGRTRWVTTTGVVDEAAVDGDLLRIFLWTNSQDGVDAGLIATLDASSMLDRWTSTPDSHAEHEYRKATDPGYLHHAEVIEEKSALAKLRTEQGDTAPTALLDGSDPTAPDAHSDTIAGRHRRLLYLDAEIKAAKACLSSLEGEYDTANAELVVKMAEEGQPSQTVDGMTGYLAPKTFVTKTPGTTPDDILAALRASGLGHMVIETYSGGALKAQLTEYAAGAAEIPAALAKVVALGKSFEVRFVKGAARKIAVTPADVLAASAAS